MVYYKMQIETKPNLSLWDKGIHELSTVEIIVVTVIADLKVSVTEMNRGQRQNSTS
jgi:hypothetical protein